MIILKTVAELITNSCSRNSCSLAVIDNAPLWHFFLLWFTVSSEQVKDNKDKEKAPKEEMKSVWDRKRGVPEQKAQNGERELTTPKLKSTENAFG